MRELFNFDSIAKVITVLIIFICAIVASYSANYFRGDKNKNKFLLMIFFIAILLITTFSVDNIFLFCATWLASNLLFVKMMIHKTSWKQAVSSGMMALKNFIIGASALTIAALFLYAETHETSISKILVNDNINSTVLLASAILITIAALTQAALYPFHSWLLNSLNSPTPASAIMHAGLVNGGGILLARFAPLLLKHNELLTAIFVIGIFSAILGTIWKLIQGNVKAMLACSTMSQMGFMIAQCALGLFSAAIAHLVWHGMFKSYLFLSSPSSYREKRFDINYPVKILPFLISLEIGAAAALIFAKISQIDLLEYKTTLVLVAVSMVAASQMSLSLMGDKPLKNLIPAIVLPLFAACVYASSVLFVKQNLAANLFAPQDLNLVHIVAISAFFLMWVVRIFFRNFSQQDNAVLMKLYVKLLNASKAKFSTTTSNRNQYNYR